MQPDKKQLEILLMDYFRESYLDFPKGKIIPTESPDFTISMKNHRSLGVELTRLNPGNAVIPDDLAMVEISFQDQLIGKTKLLFEQNSTQKLFVKFLFSDEKKIVPELEMVVSVQLVNAIRKTIQHKKFNTFFKESLSESQLPDGITDVLVVYHPVMQSSVWERSNNLGVSNNVVDDIRKSIQKKDDKLKLYQKQRLNYYWLLIFTDRLRGVKNFNLHDKIMNHKFQSHFQHVFLFDLLKTDVYELI